MFPEAGWMQFEMIKMPEACEFKCVARAVERAAVKGEDAFAPAALLTSGFTQPPTPARQDISAAPLLVTP